MHAWTKTPGMCRTFPYLSWTKWLCLQIHNLQVFQLGVEYLQNIRPALSSCVFFFGRNDPAEFNRLWWDPHHLWNSSKEAVAHLGRTELAVAKASCKINLWIQLFNRASNLWDFVRRFFSVFPVWNNAELVRMIFEFFLSLSLTVSEISSKVEAVKVIVWVLGKLETSCGRHH